MAYIGKTSGMITPGRGLINPAFVIKLVAATDILQQKPSSGRDNPNTDYLDNLKVGSRAKGKVGNKTVMGRIQQVVKNELGDCTYVVIVDSKGKVHKIESTRISTIGTPSESPDDSLVSSPAFFESKFYSFQEFLRA